MTSEAVDPTAGEFFEGVKREMAYQAERFAERDAKKSSAEWYRLVGRLVAHTGVAAIVGDHTIARERAIGAAAALGHWYAVIRRSTP